MITWCVDSTTIFRQKVLVVWWNWGFQAKGHQLERYIWDSKIRTKFTNRKHLPNVSSEIAKGWHMTFIFHFCRCFGPKCGGCGEKIHYQDFVRKARDKVYHLRCFTCSLCSKQLSTGEVLYLQPGDEGFVCKDHYLKQGKAWISLLYSFVTL